MKSAFRKISRVSTLTGGIKWYLSDDCLLAAKRVMYSIEYRRFYLHDLESIVVWPTQTWIWRMLILGVVFGFLDFAFSQWANLTTGAVFGGVGLAWVTLELVLGPTAKSRIRTTGADVDVPLVRRTRRARKVLAKIDAAVRSVRSEVAQSAVFPTSTGQGEPTVQASSENSAPGPIADPTQTNVS